MSLRTLKNIIHIFFPAQAGGQVRHGGRTLVPLLLTGSFTIDGSSPADRSSPADMLGR